MSVLNIAGYRFVPLHDLRTLSQVYFSHCAALSLKGTILLSPEGININLAGEVDAVSAFRDFLHQDARFSDFSFHESYSAFVPFKRLKVKLKKEIITFRKESVDATQQRAPAIHPEVFRTWMDEQREMVVLDTRNEYEVALGTFKGATHLHLGDFCHLPEALSDIQKEKPIVMFCTGGVRCEKAGLYLLQQGYQQVYQLDGGILGYFAKVGSAHYEGRCFVFDERTAVGADDYQSSR